jgi:hypothetical protein
MLLTFLVESGSKLTVIEREAFAHCTLTSFHIPSLLERIDDSAFESADIAKMTIDQNNRYFSVYPSFLLDFEGVSILHYFGSTDSRV